MPSSLQRLASTFVRGYLRHCPLEKGKWRLLRWSSSFLLAEPEPGTFLRVTDLDNPIELALAHRGLLEPEDVRLFLSLLGPGMTVLDVGANVGMYTLMAARRVGPAGRVHAFEPTSRVAAALRHNVALNGLSNVVVNEVALSDRPGTATFYTQQACDRNSLASSRGTPVLVRTTTLDDYLATLGPVPVDLLKMDVEGAEVLALRGAAELLSREDAPVIFLEINPPALQAAGSSPAELEELLSHHSYLRHALQQYGGGRYGNVLACKEGHLQRSKVLQRTFQG